MIVDHPSLQEFEIGQRLDISGSTRISRNAPGKDGKKRFTFVVSTASEDRHETEIMPEGGDLRFFKENPVVLFNHDQDKVIGRSPSIQLENGRIVAQVEFDSDDPFAANIERKVENGFINATSIGFIIKKWEFDEDRDVFRILEWELVEFSIVSVPSNREALVLERSLAAQVKELRSMIESIRSQGQGPGEAPQQEDVSQAVPNDAADVKNQPDAQGEEPSDPVDIEDSAAEEGAADPVEAIDANADDAIHVKEVSNIKTRAATPEDYERELKKRLPGIIKDVRKRLGKGI